MNCSRKHANLLLSSDKQGREKLLDDRAKTLREKQITLQCLQQKQFREKEEEIIVYGLRQSEAHIKSSLAKLTTDSEKLKGLKLQLELLNKSTGTEWAKRGVLD